MGEHPNAARARNRCSAAIAILLASVAFSAAMSTSSPPSAADGVYTETEARRGEAIYKATCAACHREDMGGRDPAPELAGETFMSKWSGKSIRALYTRTRTTMPLGNPDSLTAREYLDVIAFILEANEFPAGSTSLPEDSTALDAIIMQ